MSFKPLFSLEQELAPDILPIVDLLSLGIVLTQDTELQARLNPGGAPRFAVGIRSQNALWMMIDSEGAWELSRTDGGTPSLLLEEAGKADPDLQAHIDAAGVRVQAHDQARDLLYPLISLHKTPERASIRKLSPWWPLLEANLYRLGARVLGLLDQIRPLTHGRGGNETAGLGLIQRQYWAFATLMARCTLGASSRDASPWLTDLAHSFEWKTWTPTWPFLRERNLWMSAVGARSASAFGPAVIDRYKAVLQKPRSLAATWDCITGATAIALAHPDARAEIIAWLASLPRKITDSNEQTMKLVDALFHHALAILQDPDRAYTRAIELFGTDPSGPRGLFSSSILRADPGDFSVRGENLGLAILPLALTSDSSNFFPNALPSKPAQFLGLTDVELRRLFKRNTVAQEEAGSYRLH